MATNIRIWGRNSFDSSKKIIPSKQTFVIARGSISPESEIQTTARILRDQNPDANIVVIEWDGFNYQKPNQLDKKILETSKEISQFLVKTNINPSETTLIGHGAGGQVMGATATTYYQTTGTKINNGITLDSHGYGSTGTNRVKESDFDTLKQLHTSKLLNQLIKGGIINPSLLFQPGSNNAILNHVYALEIYNQLLASRRINQIQPINQVITTQPVPQQNNTGRNILIGIAGAGAIAGAIYYTRNVKWDEVFNRFKQQAKDSVRSIFLPEIVLGKTKIQIKEDGVKKTQTNNEKIINKQTSLDDWQREFALSLKQKHIQAAILARGGADRMTRNDYLAIGRELKSEYRYLRRFAQDIKDGKVSEAQLKARSALYFEKVRISEERMSQQNATDQGLTVMRRFLGFADRHCEDCIRLAELGYQPIGELPLPTQSCRCRANCKCRVEYS